MKTTILLTALLAVGFGQATAQHSTEIEKRIGKHQAFIDRLLQAQSNNASSQKPTGIAHRVVATTTYTEAGLFDDSTAYRYSGSRGSKFNYNDAYGYRRSFQDDQGPTLSAPAAPTSLPDSIKYISEGFTRFEVASYRPDNKMSQTTSHADIQASRQVNAYNAQGYRVLSYSLESNDNGSHYDTLQKRTFTYNNTFTRVMTDSMFNKMGSTYRLYGTYRYYYNSGDKLDSMVSYGNPLSPALKVGKMTFYYYPGGELMKTTMEDFSLPDVRIISVDSMGYTTGIPYTTFHSGLIKLMQTGMPDDIFGSTWINYPGTNGLPDSAQLYDYNPTTSSMQLKDVGVYRYTSFGEPDSLLVYGAGEHAPRRSIKYYYESYETTVSIKPIAASKDFSLYPNPFDKSITIDWKGKQGEQVAISLTDMIGREVLRTGLKLNTGPNGLNLPHLNPGAYILLIRDAAGKTWSSKVIRQ
ncbi:T9SS type A sorting domain-containing protein [Taibaiella koreensis]|uniref:T9SS type A sorting domain-containing protein n=1 Tax=Taibaiella koreensis TaxID=1268548 RepID=UPI000E59A611|nr:T9SS type A sorting domain-containing protein [Taibaiella koreensis]